MRYAKTLSTLSAIACLNTAGVAAQAPANDPSARLAQVLPAGVAAQVLAVIAKARAHELPTQALENRALKFAARGVHPDSIKKSVEEQERRMETANDALRKGRGQKPTGDEIEAGAEAIRKGVDGAKVSELAKSAPSGRSLAVPLYVIGSLIDRGLPSDAAHQRVLERLQARATDSDIERLPGELPSQADAGQANKPALTGRDLAATKRAAGAGQSGSAGGPPAGVPANGGAGVRPGQANRPVTPAPKKP